ncbi:hypothetical protein BC834DRAFT_443081 [Gloeopeniophorella convolvens]|nr:hypothetical protein BC834DRAFT_443081 [Gloeopeniophorella convolvens]
MRHRLAVPPATAPAQQPHLLKRARSNSEFLMVRTQPKPTPEEKKDTQKKKSSSSKKKVETGIWPCKMGGCNKEFAREADLKRHQRTTKTHTRPGFTCPQCEATFTRTDALRRHQKSRHNGVIIEPDNSAGSNATGEENAGRHPVPPGPPPQPGYYRQSGINAEFLVYVRGPHGVLVEPSYPVGIPTSAARLAQPQWVPPPWPDGAHPIPFHSIPGAPPGYYGPYYHPGMLPPPPLPGAPLPPNIADAYGAPGSAVGEAPRVPHDEPGAPASPKSVQEQEAGTSDGLKSRASPGASAPVIDPSLDASGPNTEGKSAVSLAITSAAVQAVLDETRRLAKQQAEDAAKASESRASSPRSRESEGNPPAEVSGSMGVDSSTSSESGPPTGANPPSTMLTEDGETMLHPAELLTQESLASPPPSDDP